MATVPETPKLPDALNTLYQQAEAAVASLMSTTHFLFEVANQPKATFNVMHWQGNEAISSSYRYTLSLAGNNIPDTKQFLGKEATLSIEREGEMRLIHGYVSGIERIGELVADHAIEYQITFESPLARLKLTRQSRIFLNLDLKAVIEQILLGAGFTATGFQLKLASPYPVREYTAQYNETDFNFFSRLLEHAGAFYTFVQQDEQALLVIQDDSASLPQMPATQTAGTMNSGTTALIYLPASGQVEGEESVQLLQQELHCLPASVTRRDHNYRTPETTLHAAASSNSTIPAAGTDYVYGERAASLEEADWLARRRQEMYDCQREIYHAESNCRGMTSGTTFSVSGHPQDQRHGDYLVVSVLHQGDQSAAFAFGGARNLSAASQQGKTRTYHNELVLIKQEIPYRPAVDRSRMPLVYGVLSARIETTGGDYAYLDDHGRYRLKNLYDTADTQAGEASHPVRMMQASAGSNYGMHFPLHAGTEVLVACMNGDPDRPVILGAVSNPASRSPVTSANASQHLMRTAAGNELLLDDLEDSEKINLHTKNQKNILTLDANSDGHKVALRSEEGLAEFYAKKTMHFESGDTYSIISGNDQSITVENKHSLQTNKKDIALNAATDIALTAKHHIKLNTEEKDISLTSGQDLIIETGKDLSVRVMDGDSSYTIQQGSVSFEAANAITILAQDGPITIEQGAGMIELSDGKFSVKAPQVGIEGNSVAITGQNATMTGGGGGVASKPKPAAKTQPAPTQSSAANASSPAAPMTAASLAMGAPAATSTLADTPQAATAKKAEETGRFITAEEGQKIADVAKEWKGTPYGTGNHAGGNPVKGEGADCSGAVWAIYKEAGFSYGSYHSTATFHSLVGSDASFISGKHFFKQVSTPQVGDVGWWNGHMAIYDPNAGKTDTDTPLNGNQWSARTTGKKFGATRQNWYDNYVDSDTGKEYGIVKWYRYWKEAQ